MDIYGSDYKYILLVRPEIESIICERYPELEINPKSLPKGKYINGKYLLKDYINTEKFPDEPIQENGVDKNLIIFKNLWDSINCFNEVFNYDFLDLLGEILSDFNKDVEIIYENYKAEMILRFIYYI